MNRRKPLILGALCAASALLLYCGKSSSPVDPGNPGNTVPVVTHTVPADQAANIPVNTNIEITFNVAMDTAATRAAVSSSPAIAGAFSWDTTRTILTWNPAADRSVNTQYTVTVAASAKSKTGIAMAGAYSFSFTTTVNGGTLVPVVTSTNPQSAAIGVSVATLVTLTFNVPMNADSTQAAISASPAMAGTYAWDNGDTKVTLTPAHSLTENTKYTVTVAATARSKAGIAMAASYTFSFTTGVNPKPTQIVGGVYRREDSVAIEGANVILYSADNNSPLLRTLSGANGKYTFRADSGNYYLTVTAQGRISSPPPGGRYTPFRLDLDSTYTRNFYLRRDTSSAGTGGISGKVVFPDSLISKSGILIVAIDSNGKAYSSTTGPDGYFVIYNLPPGTYSLVGYRSGVTQDTLVAQVSVGAGVITPNVVVGLLSDPGRALTGKVSFVSSPNGLKISDITLVDTLTRLAIPGLSTYNDAGLNYRLGGIPPGDYIAWGSYKNDGYTIDPDYVRKQGLPRIRFLPADTLKTLNFTFTHSINILRPTNPPDSLYPARIDSLKPYFVWEHDPSAKQYVLQVFDNKGDVIWGGWKTLANGDDSILHAPIPAVSGLDSVKYNFDGSAKEALSLHNTYSWKVYADFGTSTTITHFQTSSEDLMGLFVPGGIIDSVDCCATAAKALAKRSQRR